MKIPNIKETLEGVILPIKVIASSSVNKVVGWESHHLKVKLTAPPEKGKANEALIDILADFFGIAKSKISILQGHTNPKKTVCLGGMTKEMVERICALF